MNFCAQCFSTTDKEILRDNKIVFKCPVCSYTVAGGPDDSLLYEDFLGASESTQKHEVFIENSAFDPVGCTVTRDCPQCGLDFMTMVRVGSSETTIYTCTCGYRSTYADTVK